MSPVDIIATPVVGLLGVLLGLTLLAFWFDQHVSVSVGSRAGALMVVIRQEGDQVTFEAGGSRYTGRVNGDTIDGTLTSGSSTSNFKASRVRR